MINPVHSSPSANLETPTRCALGGPPVQDQGHNLSWNPALSQESPKYSEPLSKPWARKPKLQIPCSVPGPGLGPDALEQASSEQSALELRQR